MSCQTLPNLPNCLKKMQQLLSDLLSSENEKRGKAESALTRRRHHHPQKTLLDLLHIIGAQELDDSIRGLSAVLLRRVLLNDQVSLWPLASEEVKDELKQKMLLYLTNEHSNDSIRHKLCDMIGELASGILEDGQWDNLLPILTDWNLNRDCLVLRENSLRIIELIAGYLTCERFLENNDPSLLVGLFERNLQDREGKVGLQAIRGVAMLLLNTDSQEQLEHYVVLWPKILECIHFMLSTQQFEQVQESLEVLIELMEDKPLFFHAGLQEFLLAMTSMAAESAGLPSNIRQLAMEFLVCTSENCAALCRKLSDPSNPSSFNFVDTVFPVAFQMMLEIEDMDLEEWTQSNENEDDEEITNYDVGSEALDRLAQSLGAKRILPYCFTVINEFLTNSGDWKFRFVALMSLSQILEVIPECKETISPLIETMLKYTQDPHPRVCYAAVNCIGQISSDHGPFFQTNFTEQTLPVLLYCLDNTTTAHRNIRVQAHSAAAVINFVDTCPSELLEPYLEKLLSVLFANITNGPNVVQEQAITAVASIADNCQHLFTRFYDTFMPALKEILVHSIDKLIQGKTIECISLIGVAVGKEIFHKDAVGIMEFIMLLQQKSQSANDAPEISYLLQSWARICKCLGKDFSPYLPLVMPCLLELACQNAEVVLEEYPQELEHDDEEIVTTADNKCVSVRTCILEDKATACEILSCMISDLQETFFPYVEQVTKILAPLLTDSVHPDIRSASITAMPALILCVSQAINPKSSSREPVKQLVEFVIGKLLNALQTESELELVMTLLQAIKVSVENAARLPLEFENEVLSSVVLNEAQLTQIIEGFMGILADSFQRRALNRALGAVDDLDDEEREEAMENNQIEAELQFVLVDSISGLIKTHRNEFLSVFQHTLLDKIQEMCPADCLEEDRKFGVYIIDDIIEYTGDQATEFFPILLPILINCMKNHSNSPSLVQASAYGIGVAAKLGGDHFTPYLGECMEVLSVYLENEFETEEEQQFWQMAIDNIVSAFGLLNFHHYRLIRDSAVHVRNWLGCLPLTGDLMESKEVTIRLIQMVQSKNTYLFGPANENLSQVLLIFARIIALELYDEEGKDLQVEIAKAFFEMQKSVKPEVIGAICTASDFSPEQQQLLHNVLLSASS